jgi:hypothetical protein
MPELEIERLTLRLSGYSEDQGRRLARLIAEGLADSPIGGGAQDRPAMESKQAAPAGASVEDLSDRIVEDLLRQLERTA